MTEEIRRFNRYYARVLGIFSRHYLDSNFSLTEVRVLGELSRSPGIPASEIAAFLDVDKSYLSRIIGRFEKEGLVCRQQNKENWRLQNLFLTPEGQCLSEDLDRRADERIMHQVQSLSEADLEQLQLSMQVIERLLSPIIPSELSKKESVRHMTLRACTTSDADLAMKLIDGAKAFLRAQGIDQWQTGYPDRNCIEHDIAAGKGFFLIEEPDQILGYMCIDFDGEPAYDNLSGEWLTGAQNHEYAVVHRLALSSESRGKGTASIAFQEIERFVHNRGVHSIRVDTDDANAIMKHLLSKHGYIYCGTICFDNSEKIAYEKCLK